MSHPPVRNLIAIAQSGLRVNAASANSTVVATLTKALHGGTLEVSARYSPCRQCQTYCRQKHQQVYRAVFPILGIVEPHDFVSPKQSR